MKSDTSKASPASAKPRGVGPIPVFSTDTLFAGASEILIKHDELVYRLRITRNRKMILTK